MLTLVYGFDWEAYTDYIMPTFTRWLLHGDEKTIHQLYERTRCAREEQFTPVAIRHLLTWPRAQAFVQQLPQGSYTRREYQLICDAQSFTDVSDTYVHRHPPRLHQSSDAIRAVWGALVEQYCLSQLTLPETPILSGHTLFSSLPYEQCAGNQNDIVSLLHSAGFSTLASEISIQPLIPELAEEVDISETFTDSDPDLTTGFSLGHHPATLHLRGWLASLSVRAMVLFELLACGRRSMPFGHRPGEPYEDYVGYLTPGEVRQLAHCLHNVDAPNTALHTEQDYPRFLIPTNKDSLDLDLRFVDEILPVHANALLHSMRIATQHDLGLICRAG